MVAYDTLSNRAIFCMNANKAQNPKKKYKKTLTSFIFCIFACENKIMKQ